MASWIGGACLVGLLGGFAVRDTPTSATAKAPESNALEDAAVLAASVSPSRVALAPPSVADYDPVFDGADLLPPKRARRFAQATRHLAPVWNAVSSGKKIVGRVREGAVLGAEPARRRCGYDNHRGYWYKVDGGYLCSGIGFDVGRTPPADKPEVRSPPANQKVLPHPYAKVSQLREPIFERQPSLKELNVAQAAIAAGRNRFASPVRELADGAYWLALNEQVEVEGRKMWRTLSGDFVDAERLDHREMPTFHGEAIGPGEARLPLAFANHDEGARVECIADDGSWQECGHVKKHARFHVARTSDDNDQSWVYSDDGWRVARDRVRVASKRGLPFASFKKNRWVHINLDEQTLIAYEGRTPVWATLVSTGKGKFATPTGAFQILRKYLTKTMAGPDPDVGRYHIEDIPWVMYYNRGYAVHGAYWHENFGNVRSHGCTNLAPADARWLYHWSTPKVPDGWHAAFGDDESTWFYFTRDLR